jgi:D-cysteine desulfhydrase family pyridoxal phosphate-dependent enzyme
MPLGRLPRLRLASLPTPLHELPRLRDALGGPRRAPRLLVKRDDLTGLALGGNKARKLEFLLADAQRAGATIVVTSGAVQSNHARMTAAAACAAGLKCALVLTSREALPEVQGNLLVDYLLGAEIYYIAAGDDPRFAVPPDEAAQVEAIVQRLAARGERPYVVPIGGSSGVGALGYVAGTLELVTQLAEAGESPTRLYYASGSRGTQAGLELGARMFSAPYKPVGVAVSAGEDEKRVRAERLANEAAGILGTPIRARADELVTHQEYFGDGYGIPTPGCLEALTLTARTEGLLLDPTYTAKAMAGLIDHVRRGFITPDETVVFLHTGGTPALFAHAATLAAAAGALVGPAVKP